MDRKIIVWIRGIVMLIFWKNNVDYGKWDRDMGTLEQDG